jgi:hypothetical protein
MSLGVLANVVGTGAALCSMASFGSNAVCLILSGAILVLKWRFEHGQSVAPAAAPPAD